MNTSTGVVVRRRRLWTYPGLTHERVNSMKDYSDAVIICGALLAACRILKMYREIAGIGLGIDSKYGDAVDASGGKLLR